jgi:hypothetical protein
LGKEKVANTGRKQQQSEVIQEVEILVKVSGKWLHPNEVKGIL